MIGIMTRISTSAKQLVQTVRIVFHLLEFNETQWNSMHIERPHTQTKNCSNQVQHGASSLRLEGSKKGAKHAEKMFKTKRSNKLNKQWSLRFSGAYRIWIDKTSREAYVVQDPALHTYYGRIRTENLWAWVAGKGLIDKQSCDVQRLRKSFH